VLLNSDVTHELLLFLLLLGWHFSPSLHDDGTIADLKYSKRFLKLSTYGLLLSHNMAKKTNKQKYKKLSDKIIVIFFIIRLANMNIFREKGCCCFFSEKSVL